MKKLIAMILVLVLTVTSLGISAFAYSDVRYGTYEGVNWIARLNRNGLIVTSNFKLTNVDQQKRMVSNFTAIKISEKNRPTPYWHELGGWSMISCSVGFDYSKSGNNKKILDSRITYSYRSLSGTFYV